MGQIDPGRIDQFTICTHRQPVKWRKRDGDLPVRATIFDGLGEFSHQPVHMVTLRDRETFKPAFEITDPYIKS